MLASLASCFPWRSVSVSEVLELQIAAMTNGFYMGSGYLD